MLPASTAPVASLCCTQLNALSSTNLQALSSAQAAALSTTQAANLSSTQLDALQTSDVAALSTAAVASLTTTQLNALGSTNGNTTVMGGTGGFLYLGSNLHIAEPLILNGEFNNGGTLRSELGNCILGGPISLYNQVRLQIYSGSLSITGGVTAVDGAGGLFVLNSGATTVFSTTPLNLGAKTFYTDSGGLTVLAPLRDADGRGASVAS